MAKSRRTATYVGQPPSNGKERQCEAALSKDTKTGKKGDRCPNYPILGGNVCPGHGAKASQVKEAAAVRLAKLVDPSISALAEDLAIPKNADIALRRLRNSTAQDILDRNNYRGKQDIDLHTFSMNPSEMTDEELRAVAALRELLGSRKRAASDGENLKKP